MGTMGQPRAHIPGNIVSLCACNICSSDILWWHRRRIEKRYTHKGFKLPRSPIQGQYRSIRQNGYAHPRKLQCDCGPPENDIGGTVARYCGTVGIVFKPSHSGIDNPFSRRSYRHLKNRLHRRNSRTGHKSNNRRKDGACRQRKAFIRCRCTMAWLFNPCRDNYTHRNRRRVLWAHSDIRRGKGRFRGSDFPLEENGHSEDRNAHGRCG